MANQGRPWTREEEDIVRLRYSDDWEANKQLARDIDRSYQALKLRALLLQVQRRRKNGWTPEEDDKLVELSGCYCVDIIARKMHRGIGSIRGRQKYLSIKMTSREDWYTLRETAEILGVSMVYLRKWIDLGKLTATRHNHTTDVPKTTWHITKEDLRSFIRRYPLELTGRNIDIVQIVEILAGIDYLQNKKVRKSDVTK